jgi:hypothetical protein
MEEIIEVTGVKSFRVVSPSTTVIELTNGGVRPATQLEQDLWRLLLTTVTPH